MEPIHRRILMDPELLLAAKQGDESRFARLVGLEEDEREITINESSGIAIERCIARDEPDFFLGVTFTGNSLLHLAASSSNFLDLAEKIWRRERSLLTTRNKVLDTPLHYAARNGNHEMVSHFIGFAREMGEGVLEEVLRAKNKHGESALHEAAWHNYERVAAALIDADPELACVGRLHCMRLPGTEHGETALHEVAQHNDECVAAALIDVDPELARVVDYSKVSPLYLATISESLDVVRAIIRGLSTQEVIRKAFVAGPDGQTALHAAVLRSEGLTEELLNWQPLLARMPDNTGSTPLHFVASFGYTNTARILLKHDHSVAYLHDSCGLFPVHVAARMGHVEIIKMLLKHCPDSDELVDDEGRNFLHVAVQERQHHVVHYICQTNAKYKIMKNARDNEGNTPIHLALNTPIPPALKIPIPPALKIPILDLNSGHELTIVLLLGDKEVLACISNKKGLTPQDLSEIAHLNDNAIKPIVQIVDDWIKCSMKLVGGRYGPWRWDHFVRDHTIKEDPKKENKKLTSAIQNIGFASVLIATVTFAAAFTLPGGYRADDHHKAGTPTLAKKYVFKAFLVADLLAFVLSFHSTIMLLLANSSNPRWKKAYVSSALWFIIVASRCMAIAVGLAVLVVLAPINKFLGILALVQAVAIIYSLDNLQLSQVDRIVRQRNEWKQHYNTHFPMSHLLILIEGYLPITVIFLLPLFDLVFNKLLQKFK